LSNGDSSGSIASYQSKIGSIVQNFDEYEKYQYYSSGSLDIYPKLNDTPPYILALTSSTEAQSWLTDQAINSGSEYDNENVDRLYNSLPSYVQDDTRNTQFFLFIDMVGQHFDNIWVYTKDLSNRFDADNRLTYGISKDIVADAIRSMGVNLYQNNFSSENILTSLTGMNSEGGLLIPTGSEVIEEYITAPYNYKGLALQNTEYFTNDVFYYYYGVQKFWVKIISPTYTTPNQTVGSAGWQINLLNTEGINTEISEAENAFLSPTKLDDVNKEFYKRIFHNLPLLLKQKGSISGLRNLINTFGIPDTILRISEFGGKDKNERLDYDYYQDVFNYAAYLSGSSTTSRISIPFVVNSNWGSDSSRPEGMSFRFKPDTSTLPSTDTYSLLGAGNNEDSQITLTYTGSGYISESYSGSIPSESKYMAHITLWDDGAEVTSLSAPIYNGNWWTVGIGINGDSAPYIVALTVAESIYEGDDGFKIGHIATSQGNSSNMAGWKGTSTYVYPYTSTNGVSLDGNDYYGLTGSYQEIKFYNYPVDKTKIYDTTVNPHAILGENPSSSADNIIFRAPLGSELNTTTGTLTSVHPKITGSNILNSFSSDSNYTVGEDIIFLPNTEYYYYVQVPSGIKNRVKEKIRSGSLSLPSGDTLSPIRSIQQNYLTKESGSYTKDINLLEIAFSPQNEINDDINSSMGYFNIGEYIGDPRQISESVTSYPLLDNLRDTYFQKYYKNYNWNDYIRLIKFFDNSLFKMIKDFTPAKSSLATGVVIKQHLLERNKQRPALVTSSLYDYSGSIESGFTSGGTGGVFDSINTLTSSVSPQITQSWDYTIQTLSGSLSVNQSTQDEFYNGELSGSEFTATNGELFINTVDSLTTSSFTQDRENSSGIQLFNFPSDWANDPINGRAIIIVDTNINKITTIGLGGIATNANSQVIFDFRGYYDLLGIGDVLTFAIPGPSPYTTPALNFTITNKRKYVNGSYNNYIFSVEHDWAPVGGWALLIENVAQYPPYGNLGGYLPWNGLIQIYDGSPINLREIYPDPSLNNVSNTRKSLIYQDVDYSTNAVTPVNYDLLKSNSALKAPIQDSNYTKKSWINSRYRGTRVSSLDFNTTIER
ncbi:hypothetical protein N8580_01595, partial [Akkermansiaceae bacterium]|nr:hypothetical protein [Akkermansiaceae bacterium]